MPETLRELSGAWNFRDVADETAGLRPGRLFRSGELCGLDEDGGATLLSLGITDVADLRANREVARRGAGRVPAGIEIHLLPMPDLGKNGEDDTDSDDDAPHESAFRQLLNDSGESNGTPAEAAARYMIQEYREFPTRSGTQRALRSIITLLGAGRPVLTHCFAGKDRTGFVIATVLQTIGLDRDLIVADYLRSNDSVWQLRKRINEMIEQRTDIELTPEVVKFTQARLSDEILGVREEYLDSSRQVIEDAFGSLDAYLRDSGITEEHVENLRAALLG